MSEEMTLSKVAEMLIAKATAHYSEHPPEVTNVEEVKHLSRLVELQKLVNEGAIHRELHATLVRVTGSPHFQRMLEDVTLSAGYDPRPPNCMARHATGLMCYRHAQTTDTRPAHHVGMNHEGVNFSWLDVRSDLFDELGRLVYQSPDRHAVERVEGVSIWKDGLFGVDTFTSDSAK